MCVTGERSGCTQHRKTLGNRCGGCGAFVRGEIFFRYTNSTPCGDFMHASHFKIISQGFRISTQCAPHIALPPHIQKSHLAVDFCMCGGSEIRTREGLSSLTVFKTAAFNQLSHPSISETGEWHYIIFFLLYKLFPRWCDAWQFGHNNSRFMRSSPPPRYCSFM